MPAHFEGTLLRSGESPILDLDRPRGLKQEAQRDLLNVLREYNNDHRSIAGDSPALAARIASYELAYKMQSSAPEAVDLTRETEETRRLYGMDRPKTEPFGRQCLLARRLVERGVRFIQIYSGGNHNDTSWDAHGDLVKNHDLHCGETDKPIAGLIEDLKRRGLFDSTLIVWGGEFGRQPTAEYAKGTGRDHNAYGFTMWMAGGGIKGGVSVGTTDELGSAAVEKPYHVKNLHATILHQLGIDPDRLTFFYSGLDQKLVGVEGAAPIAEVDLKIDLRRHPDRRGTSMPISRRIVLKGLGTAGQPHCSEPDVGAAEDEGLKVAGRAVEVSVTPIGPSIVRVSVVPIEGGRPQPIPADGSLVRLDWGEPILRLTSLAEPRVIACGDSRVTVSGNPLTIRIEAKDGRLVQRLRVDATDRLARLRPGGRPGAGAGRGRPAVRPPRLRRPDEERPGWISPPDPRRPGARSPG